MHEPKARPVVVKPIDASNIQYETPVAHGSIIEPAGASAVQNAAIVVGNKLVYHGSKSERRQDSRTTMFIRCNLSFPLSLTGPTNQTRFPPDCLQICATKTYKAQQLMHKQYWVPRNEDRVHFSAEIPVFWKIWCKHFTVAIG